MYYIVGLGNPGEEYEKTRHNAGRLAAQLFSRTKKFEPFLEDKKINALKSEGKIGKEKVLVILPETYMNKSGSALKKIITSKKKAEKLIVVHDDIDLPLGRFKISFGSGSAGHRGVESVMRILKTKNFIRVRIGTILATPKGKLKKPKREKLLDFLMANFKPSEMKILNKVIKKIIPELEEIVYQRELK